MQNTQKQPQLEQEILISRGYRISWIAFISMLVITILLWVTSPDPLISMMDVRLFALEISLAGLVSIVMARFGKPRVGVGIILFILNVTGILTALVISGAGVAISAVILILTLSFGSFMFTPRGLRYANIFAIVVSVFVILLDVFEPFQRIPNPTPIQTWIITGILLIVYGVLIVRQFYRYPLRTKLVISFVIVSIISLGVITWMVTYTLQQTLRESVGTEFSNLSSSQRDVVYNYFLENIGQLQVLSEIDYLQDLVEERNNSYTGSTNEILGAIQNVDNQWVRAGDNDPLILGVISDHRAQNPLAFQLHEFKEAIPVNTEVFITDQYGATIAATDRLSDYYQADEGWWQAAWNDGEGALYISEPVYDESAQVTALIVSLPIYANESGKLIGILRSTIIIDSVYQYLAETQIGETGYVILVDRDGKLLFDPRADTGKVSELPPDFIAKAIKVGSEHVQEENEGETAHYDLVTDLQGNELIVGHFTLTPLEEDEEYPHAAFYSVSQEEIIDTVNQLGWTIFLRQETNEAFETIPQITRRILMVALLILAVVVAAAFWIAQIIVAPISHLTSVAQRFGQGDMNVQAEVETSDEVGTLAETFNAMAEQVQDLVGTLEQRVTERTRALATSTEVSRRLSTILDERELVTQVVEQVQQAFDYYHAHIYFFDESKQDLIMVGGTGEVGEIMLSRGHKIPKGRGLVGRAAETNNVVLVSDTSKEAGWLPNELLPDTRSEAAVPIAIGENVLGVLDVQDDEIDGLKREDADLLQSIANQVAIAVQNARAYQAARRRAERETMVTSIAHEIQSANNVDEALKVAVRELGRALKTDTSVRLATILDGKGAEKE
ncbi:MAG: GAF domain-containing protein [Anaerolineales bacterium]|nr:GAF domain-containing protein [Anaerolineales bacterium]